MKKIDPAKWPIYYAGVDRWIAAIFFTTNAKIAKNIKTGAFSI